MTMPSEAQYRELIAVLQETDRAFTAAKNDSERLKISRQALRSVLRFLWLDAEVTKGGFTRPLSALANATYNAGQGARVALLEHPPTLEGKKPTGLAHETVQGCIAFSLEIVVRAKMGQERGATWIASEAHRLGICDENGTPFHPKQVITWRKEINSGRAPHTAREVFEAQRQNPINNKILQGLRKDKLAPEDIERAKTIARIILEATAKAAPRAAPKASQRA